MVVHKKLYTVDEFEKFITLPENRDSLFELINGKIAEKMPTEEHGVIVSNLNGWLFIHLQQHDIGRVVIEGRHQVPHDNQNARLPDLCFTAYERTLPVTTKGAVPQMPDLAIEVKSPDDSYRGMREKADYYLANGSQAVWLIYPEKRLVEVYLANGDIDLLGESDRLSGGDLLPGFNLEVSKIFKA